MSRTRFPLLRAGFVAGLYQTGLILVLGISVFGCLKLGLTTSNNSAAPAAPGDTAALSHSIPTFLAYADVLAAIGVISTCNRPRDRGTAFRLEPKRSALKSGSLIEGGVSLLVVSREPRTETRWHDDHRALRHRGSQQPLAH